MKCWKCQNEITTMDGITGALICRKCFEGEKLQEHLGPLKEMEPRFTLEQVDDWVTYCAVNDIKPVMATRDPVHGLTAVTERNRKEQG